VPPRRHGTVADSHWQRGSLTASSGSGTGCRTASAAAHCGGSIIISQAERKKSTSRAVRGAVTLH
jgi:hypothetical protein